MDFPFQPVGALGTTPAASTQIVVTTSVQQITLPPLLGAETMRLVVSGTAVIAWSYGVSSGLLVTNGVNMLPNTIEVFTLPAGTTQLSVIGAGAGSTLIVHVGVGL